MVEQRPRRALRPSLVVRIARIAAPVALAGAVTAGVAIAASPNQTQIAYPVPVGSVSATPSGSPLPDRHVRGSRAATAARPSLSATPSPSASPSASVKPASKPEAEPKAEVKAEPKAKAMAEPKAKVASKPAVKAPALKVTDTLYVKVNLFVRSGASKDAKVVTVVNAGSKLSVTSAVRNGYRYVKYDGSGRWVKNQYLVEKKPEAAKAKSGSISTAACGKPGSSMSGVSSDAKLVHRALCGRYPQFTSFGGLRGGGGNHGSGLAVDAMISNSKVGWQAANWLRANAKKLGVSEIIFERKIWTVQRGREGWRSMSDRGSASANHEDHVHVSVYGNRATI